MSQRITSAQKTYLTRLLNEAFSKLYTPTPFGHVALNQLHTMTMDQASDLLSHLLKAKARGWSSWESTAEGQAKATSDAERSKLTLERVTTIKALKAQGFVCNCATQMLEVDVADKSKCPLHSRCRF